MKAIFKGVAIAVLAIVVFVVGIFVGRSKYSKPCNPRYEFLSEVCEEMRADWERGVGQEKPGEPVDIKKILQMLKISAFSKSYPRILKVVDTEEKKIEDLAFEEKEIETDYGSKNFLYVKGDPYLLILHGNEGESNTIKIFSAEFAKWTQRGGGLIIPRFTTDYAVLQEDASLADLAGQTLLGRRIARVESIVRAVAGDKKVVAFAHSSGSIVGLIWAMLSDRVKALAVDYNYGGLSGACELGFGPSFYILRLKQTLPMDFKSFFESKKVDFMDQPYSYVDRNGLNKWLDEEFLKAKRAK